MFWRHLLNSVACFMQKTPRPGKFGGENGEAERDDNESRSRQNQQRDAGHQDQAAGNSDHNLSRAGREFVEPERVLNA